MNTKTCSQPEGITGSLLFGIMIIWTVNILTSETNDTNLPDQMEDTVKEIPTDTFDFGYSDSESDTEPNADDK